MNGEATWLTYCLSSSEGARQTYVGATNNEKRRLRQHNGELKGGARATHRESCRPWRYFLTVQGCRGQHDALSFERSWKNVSRKYRRRADSWLDDRVRNLATDRGVERQHVETWSRPQRVRFCAACELISGSGKYGHMDIVLREE